MLAVRVTLPAGIVPIDATLAGTMVDGAWTATYVAVPIQGLAIELTLPDRAEPLEFTIAAITDHLPGAPLHERLPVWLKTDTTAWTARSWYVIRTREAGAPGGAASATPSGRPGQSP